VRIILNTGILRSPQTGIGTYVTELARALQHTDALQLTFFDGRAITTNLESNAVVSHHKWRARLRNLPGAYSLRRSFEQRAFTRSVAQSQPDIYHDPSLWPFRFHGPTVMTVHDLTHIDYAYTQPQMRVREIERRLPVALEHASRVLVDSQFIAQELRQHYSVSPQKIVVAPLAHGGDFEPRRQTQLAGTLKRFKLEYQRYLVFVGTLEPRKNLDLALRAHAALPSTQRARFPLIIVGGDGWLSQNIECELNKAIAKGYARRLGYLDRNDVADILAGAKIFIFPSLYEGFGIPVLEAMASGVPVISSNAASLPEVGGDAVRYIDPHDAAGLAESMAALIDDGKECNRLITAGIERAKLFSWEKCAAITAGVYRTAIAGN
jgi:alpha-1,3-rhamnosyl/mannosyltransferase